MSKKKIAIICNGKELMYGSSLAHLFKYIGEREVFFSSASEMFEVELFSEKAFEQAVLPESMIKISCGEMSASVHLGEIILKKYGMTINKVGSGFSINANPKELSEKEYIDFISYANEKRDDYVKREKDYVKNVLEKDKNWIPLEFAALKNKGLFGNVKFLKKKKQQQFDCLAFVLYFITVNQGNSLEE